MKQLRILLVTFAMACISVAASAQTSIIFTNNDGTFAFDENTADTAYNTLSLGTLSNGLGDPGTLTGISGLSSFGIPDQSLVFSSCAPTCLGSITLQTGTLKSGSILSSAHFNAGGSFSVDYNGLGIIFSGTFTKASWTSLGSNTWVFSGTIMDGTLTIGGNMYTIPTAATVQLTTVGASPQSHTNKKTITFSDSQGTTNFSIAPEPGSLVLFGSGLVAVGFFTRRRLAQQR